MGRADDEAVGAGQQRHHRRILAAIGCRTAPPVAVPAAACLVNISGSGCTGGAWGASEACAVVPVPHLHYGMALELEALAKL